MKKKTIGIMFAVIIAVSLFMVPVGGLNVKKFEKDVFLNGKKLPTQIAVPPGQDAIISPCPSGPHILKVPGKSIKSGIVGLTLYDDDGGLRFGDDDLASIQGNFPNGFTLNFELFCVDHSWSFCGIEFDVCTVESARSSGEQTAEIYVKDGNLRIPVDMNGKDTYWRIHCKKLRKGVKSNPNTSSMHGLGRAGLYVPCYAITEPTEFSCETIIPHSSNRVPSGFCSISEAFNLSPTNVTLEKPISVHVIYTDGEVEGFDESTLAFLSLTL